MSNSISGSWLDLLLVSALFGCIPNNSYRGSYVSHNKNLCQSKQFRILMACYSDLESRKAKFHRACGVCFSAVTAPHVLVVFRGSRKRLKYSLPLVQVLRLESQLVLLRRWFTRRLRLKLCRSCMGIYMPRWFSFLAFDIAKFGSISYFYRMLPSLGPNMSARCA